MEAFSFAYWYQLFKEDTIKSIILPISNNILNYLLEDSTLVLPKEVYESRKQSNGCGLNGSSFNSEEENENTQEPSFPDFSDALKDAVVKLGGEVFIKVNSIAPVDAAWITTTRSLQCKSIEDIYLLLKSSNLVAKELSECKEKNIDCVISLKQWKNIHPGHEFRCFILKNKLVAISQRDYKIYYNYIERVKYDIINEIEEFFTGKIKHKFPAENYIFDILRGPNNSIQLLDFSSLESGKTKTLLFSWEDLKKYEEENYNEMNIPEFRFLDEDPGIQPNVYLHYGLPEDSRNFLQGRINCSLIDCVMQEVTSQSSEMEDK